MVLSIFLLTLVAIDICVLTKKNIAETFPISCLSITLVMYFISLFNFLQAVKIIIVIFAVIFSVIIIICFSKQYVNIALRNLLSPSFLAFLCLTLLTYMVSNDVQFFQWDEFSHWGLTVKDMFYSKRLSVFPDSATWFKTYPPGMALWQYFFISWYSNWNDEVIVFAYNFFLILMIMPVFKKIQWENKSIKKFILRNLLSIFIVFIIIYMIPYIYNNPWEGTPWRCIYIDRAISYLFAYVLFTYFGNKNCSNFHWLSIALGYCVLCLLKSIGLFFIFMSLIIILVDMCVEKKNGKRKCLVFSSCSLIIYLSWNLVLKVNNVKQIWNANGTLSISSITSLFAGTEEEWRYKLVKDFFQAIFSNTIQVYPGIIKISIIAMPVIWAFLYLFLYLFDKNHFILSKRSGISSFVLIFFGFIIYEISILFTDLYIIPRNEAVILPSFSRYSSNYILGVFCFLILFIIDTLIDKPISLSFLLLFMILINPINQVYLDLFYHDTAVEKSYATTGFSDYIENEKYFSEILSSEDKVFIVSQGNSQGYYILTKQMVPAHVNPSVLESTNENIQDEWIKKIMEGNYSYVFINKSNEQFKEYLKPYIPEKYLHDNELLKVYKAQDNTIQFLQFNTEKNNIVVE